MKRLIFFLQSQNYRSKLVLTCLLVGILPLIVMGIFCYKQTVHLLFVQERTSMDSALHTAVASIDSQIVLYEDLLDYLSCSDPVIRTPLQDSSKIYDTYELLNYEFDVFLKNIYAQHPEIEQITVYNAHSDLTHGQQLRPLSDLFSESWYQPDAVTAHASWYLDQNGMICILQKIPDPFVHYIASYSDNLICIRLKPEVFFHVLDEIAADCHLKVSTPAQELFSFRSPSVAGIPLENPEFWTSLTADTRQNGWTVLLEKPTHFVTWPANQMAAIIILIITSCLVLIYVVSRSLSSLFVRRINHLHDRMQEVREGNLEVRISDDCPDEIGELTNNFQQMLDRINLLIKQDYTNQILLRETQLKALQAQINPHFLYNCLSLINSRAILTRQPEISRMSQLMSVFYRTTLNKGKSDTTLSDELKNVISYLDIQKLLHDNLFDVTCQIDPHLPEIAVPNLLLQPLVENAIVHGILPNKKRRGKLFLTVSGIAGQVRFTILDNGLGIPPEKLSTLLTTESGGYGLKNVNERIQLTYGESYGLTIHSIPGESTMITFSLPVSSN